MTGAIRKLRGRSLHELRVRAAQALAAASERVAARVSAPQLEAAGLSRVLGHAVAGAHHPDGLLASFREGTTPTFFDAFAAPVATIAAVRRQWPVAERETIERAEQAIRGRFDVLGFRGLAYGDPVDWHFDPVAGKRSPRVHWSRVPYLDPAEVGDHKVIWEVNRHQHFVTLGQAYWLTGDERYAESFALQLSTWMDANPPKIGINWASNLEVAFRAIAWIHALHYFRHSPALTAALYGRTLAFLDASARHLERYLSTYFSPNTHLTGEALGLLYIGTLFPAFRRAARWRRVGWDVLASQLDVQVRADGVYFEQASYYHRYTVDFYLHAVLLRERNGYEVGAHVHDKLHQLLDHLAYLIRPDGRLALVGDDDGGRLVMLTTRDPADARATLAVGAVRYARPDWAAIADGASDEVAWMLGAAGVERLASLATAPPSAPPSRAFEAGGYFVMRDGWGPGASYALVDCGPHGTMNCGHAHADALAIELVVGGRPMLVDAGTYTYPGPERNEFRASSAHNTTTLDGESSSVPATPFTWQAIAHPVARAWATDRAFDYLDGEHDGYRRLPIPATVGRTVLYLKGRFWIVADRVESAGSHTLRVHHHAAPGLDARATGSHSVEIGIVPGDDRPGLEIVVPSAPDGTSPGAFIIEPGWVSPLYGARESSAVCTYSARTAPERSELFTFLIPRTSHGAGSEVRELAARRGRIFAISGRDAGLVLRGHGDGVSGDGAETDGEWAWVSAPGPDGSQDFILLGGSRLLVAGTELVHLTAPAGWVAGRRSKGVWHLRHGRLDLSARE